MDYLEKHGDAEQQKDLKAIKRMVAEYHTLLKGLKASQKTEEDLKRFEQGVRQMVENLQDRPGLHKVTEILLKKNIGDIAPIIDGSGRRQITVQEAFSNDPAKKVDIEQKSSHTCYMLSILDSILHSGRATDILKKIKIFSANGGYIVIFPGMPNKEIRVSAEDVRRPDAVESTYIGPKILEQAYLNFLTQLKREERGRFQDPGEVLKEIFGNDCPPISIQSVTLVKEINSRGIEKWVVKPIVKDPPRRATFDARQNGYQLRNKHGELIQTIREKDMIDEDKHEMRKLIENPLRDQVREFEGPIPNYKDERTKLPVERYKFYEPDHSIGHDKFKDSDKEVKMRQYLQNISIVKKTTKDNLPLHIWTATEVGSEHYCSIRLMDSTSDQICIFDPSKGKSRKIKIGKFFKEYAVAGISLGYEGERKYES